MATIPGGAFDDPTSDQQAFLDQLGDISYDGPFAGDEPGIQTFTGDDSILISSNNQSTILNSVQDDA